MKQENKYSSLKRFVPGKDSINSSGFVRYSGIGIQLVAVILIFLFAGIWLDEKLGTKFLFTLAFTLIGFFGGFYSFYLKMKNISNPGKNEVDE